MGTWLVRRPCAPCLATPVAMVRKNTKSLFLSLVPTWSAAVKSGPRHGVEMRSSTTLGESPDLSGRLADPKEMETIYNSKDVCPLASCTPLMENTFDQGAMGPGTDGDVQGFHDSMCGPMCVCVCARVRDLCLCVACVLADLRACSVRARMPVHLSVCEHVLGTDAHAPQRLHGSRGHEGLDQPLLIAT